MLSIISLLLILTISILITRIATVALTQTGLSTQSARFQARSAFTGVGFTTAESEQVVNHPLRRRILLILMLLGNAGIVTAVTSLILGFINTGDSASTTARMICLISGVVLLWGLSMSSWVDRKLSKIISWALNRYTKIEVCDLANLLHLTGDYRVDELNVKPQDWMAERALKDLKLRDEGVIVLGITRENGRYVGAPNGDTKLQANDTLILYGRSQLLANLDQRQKGRTGDQQHSAAAREQKQVVEKEKLEDSGT